MIKKVFAKSNGYNAVVYYDEEGLAVCFDCTSLEEAKSMDFSAADDCNTIEELAMNCNADITLSNDRCYDEIIEL